MRRLLRRLFYGDPYIFMLIMVAITTVIGVVALTFWGTK